ncbi:hypothetical protein CYMTET_18421 [Cymbomonas tetramitiformis]|uniref:Phospholipid/glycerol acyltransferase domain-containing protein n=1 Tax=Cymbomonas tetramitiformis TaxID=36881 RepID=A0AAE0G8K0_9CHLO|nr:hypothetical protein CYMTET_18421 [Cymbomonas tetramitiformis]
MKDDNKDDGISAAPMIFAPKSEGEFEKLSTAFEASFLKRKKSLPTLSGETLSHKIFDISELLNEGAQAIVDDTFTKCFKSTPQEYWNWNLYLFPMWCIGVPIRYLFLFPCRLAVLIIGFFMFFVAFTLVHFSLKDGPKRRRMERSLTEFLCAVFVASWTGVIRYHGTRPSNRMSSANKVFVANHTSMIDFIILQQVCGHAVIMQKHSGWVGLMQGTIMESIGCIQFNRTEAKDRATVAARLKEHVASRDKNPLLIFPEGTCVNNEYCVMFKKGAFDLGATVYPIAIKYNKIFVDAYWNSKRQSFSQHLLRLMTSWAVMCDVWYLDPQDKLPEESSAAFAERVQKMICDKAGIKVVPWDGMLKYYRPRPNLTEKRREEFAKNVSAMLDESESLSPKA